jgi:hypothetical protein
MCVCYGCVWGHMYLFIGLNYQYLTCDKRNLGTEQASFCFDGSEKPTEWRCQADVTILKD